MQPVVVPRSPWQNLYGDWVIISIWREALDHVIVLNTRHLLRILQSYLAYYRHWRTHRLLEMDAPEPSAIQPLELGPVRKRSEVGGLHPHYERIVA